MQRRDRSGHVKHLDVSPDPRPAPLLRLIAPPAPQGWCDTGSLAGGVDQRDKPLLGDAGTITTVCNQGLRMIGAIGYLVGLRPTTFPISQPRGMTINLRKQLGIVSCSVAAALAQSCFHESVRDAFLIMESDQGTFG